MTHFYSKCKSLFVLGAALALVSCTQAERGGQPTGSKSAGTPQMQAQAYRPQEYPTPGRLPVNGGLGSAPTASTPGASQTIRIALLVPLSGEAAKLGNVLLDAATLGLFDKYGSVSTSERSTNIVLLPKDTGSTPREAALAAQQAIDEGAQLIIGPLFAKSVAAVAPVAAQRGISVISFSNDRSVAGGGVYNFGFLPEEQVARITHYMMGKGFEQLGALLPNNEYGNVLARELSEIAALKSRHVNPMQFYLPSQASFDAPVSQLLQAAATEGVAFQALFVAEGEGRLQKIAASLRKQGMDVARFRLMGTGTFDNADFIRDPNLAGSMFTSASPDKYQAFEQRFYTSYGYRPVKVAGLAYDAVALATTLAMSKGAAGFDKDTLTDRAGFVGPANGLFRLRSDGTTERGLAVMEITPSGFMVRDPAPESF